VNTSTSSSLSTALWGFSLSLWIAISSLFFIWKSKPSPNSSAVHLELVLMNLVAVDFFTKACLQTKLTYYLKVAVSES